MHSQIAERYFFRLVGAGIPDGTCQSWRVQQLDARSAGEEQARQQRMTAQAQNISRNDVALDFWIESINSGEDRHSLCKRRSDSTTKSLSID
jgi:hypothetical protein